MTVRWMVNGRLDQMNGPVNGSMDQSVKTLTVGVSETTYPTTSRSVK